MRLSRRYPGYLRVYNIEYCRALVKILREDAAGLIEMLHLKDTINDLLQRLENPDRYSVTRKLTGEILKESNARSPMDFTADEGCLPYSINISNGTAARFAQNDSSLTRPSNCSTPV